MSKEDGQPKHKNPTPDKADLEVIKDNLLKKIETERPESLEDLSVEQKAEIIETVLEGLINNGGEISFSRSVYVGPMPSPEMLAEYNNIYAGFAEALLNDFVDQGKHRRQLEGTVVTGQLKESRRGQVFAFILSMVIIGVGGFLIFLDQKVVLGLSVIATNMVALVALHLRGKRKQREDLDSKS